MSIHNLTILNRDFSLGVEEGKITSPTFGLIGRVVKLDMKKGTFWVVQGDPAGTPHKTEEAAVRFGFIVHLAGVLLLEAKETKLKAGQGSGC